MLCIQFYRLHIQDFPSDKMVEIVGSDNQGDSLLVFDEEGSDPLLVQ